MRTICTALTAMLFCSMVLADDKIEWKEYRSTEGRFKVLFPVRPVVGKVPGQKPEIHSIVVKRQSRDGLAYMCYWRIDEKAFNCEQEETAYLKGVQEGAVKAGKGVLDGEKEIKLDGLRGREFLIKISDINYITQRIYVDGRYIYTLSVWGKNRKAVESQDALKFLNSFVVEKGPTTR